MATEHKTTVVWGPWEATGDGGRHRYIETITIDGVRYTSDGGAMVAPDGSRCQNAGRGEYEPPVGSCGDSITLYSRDGGPVVERGVGPQPDPEDDCEEAIRDAIAKAKTE